MPPISSAQALTSPMQPPTFPRNKSKFDADTLSAPPSESCPSGVADVTVSNPVPLAVGHVVISVAKDINKNIRAVTAGFTRFCPMPPKSCLMTTIAVSYTHLDVYKRQACLCYNCKSYR